MQQIEVKIFLAYRLHLETMGGAPGCSLLSESTFMVHLWSTSLEILKNGLIVKLTSAGVGLKAFTP